jgi:tRNA nucleotidyltransferase (CCA-adding enzyme)
VRRVSGERLEAALPEAARPLVKALLAEAERCEVGVHLVGGPVRDWLLGRPLRDVDLIVEPERGVDATVLAGALGGSARRVVAHERFGTVRLEGEGCVVDLATVRSETYAHPGALPSVAPGSLEDDLRRRDFTVNALAVPLTCAGRRGRPAVVDPDGGLADLEARRLRIFHARSFHDDPTRALRAARLAPRLGFSLSRGSRAALRGALRDGAFGAVSGERFRAELVKLFDEPVLGLDPAAALRALSEWHVLGALEPGLSLEPGVLAPLRRLGRSLATPDWPVAPRRAWAAGLMVWLAPLPVPLRRRTLRRLAVTGDVAARIAAFPQATRACLERLARVRGRGATDAVLRRVGEDEVLALHAVSPVGVRRRIERWAREDRPAELPVNGEDLLALGLGGPALGRVLARLREAWLDRSAATREDLLLLARELARRTAGRVPKRTPPPHG